MKHLLFAFVLVYVPCSMGFGQGNVKLKHSFSSAFSEKSRGRHISEPDLSDERRKFLKESRFNKFSYGVELDIEIASRFSVQVHQGLSLHYSEYPASLNLGHFSYERNPFILDIGIHSSHYYSLLNYQGVGMRYSMVQKGRSRLNLGITLVNSISTYQLVLTGEHTISEYFEEDPYKLKVLRILKVYPHSLEAYPFIGL